MQGSIEKPKSAQGRNCIFGLLDLPSGAAKPTLVYEQKMTVSVLLGVLGVPSPLWAKCPVSAEMKPLPS